MTPRSCGRAEVLPGSLGRTRARSAPACVERARVTLRALQLASWGALGAESSQRQSEDRRLLLSSAQLRGWDSLAGKLC